jgi:hypothetical protein
VRLVLGKWNSTPHENCLGGIPSSPTAGMNEGTFLSGEVGQKGLDAPALTPRL